MANVAFYLGEAFSQLDALAPIAVLSWLDDPIVLPVRTSLVVELAEVVK